MEEKVIKLMRSVFVFSVVWMSILPGRADEPAWEYQVFILQGVTAGSAIERQDRGISVDTRRTRILNELATQGWEVVAVIGAPLSDHSVYMRRSLKK